MTNGSLTELEDGEIPSEDENAEDNPSASYSNENRLDEAEIDKVLEEVSKLGAEIEISKVVETPKAQSVLLSSRKSKESSRIRERSSNYKIEHSRDRYRRKRDRSRSERTRASVVPKPRLDLTLDELIRAPPPPPVLLPPTLNAPGSNPIPLFSFCGSARLLPISLPPPPPPPPLPLSSSSSSSPPQPPPPPLGNNGIDSTRNVDNCEVVDMDIISDEAGSADEHIENEQEMFELRSILLVSREKKLLEAARLEKKKKEETALRLAQESKNYDVQLAQLNIEIENLMADKIRILEDFKRNVSRIERRKEEASEVLKKKRKLDDEYLQIQESLLNAPDTIPLSLLETNEQLQKLSENDGNVEETEPNTLSKSEEDIVSLRSEQDPSNGEDSNEKVEENEAKENEGATEQELRKSLLKAQQSRSSSEVPVIADDTNPVSKEPGVNDTNLICELNEERGTIATECVVQEEVVDRKERGRQLLLKMCKFDLNGMCERDDHCEFYHLDKGNYNEEMMLESILRNICDYSEEDIELAVRQMVEQRAMWGCSLTVFIRGFMSHTMNFNEEIRNRFYNFYAHGYKPS